MSAVSFFVVGTPKGQPRVRAFSRGGRASVYDPGTADEWKRLIAIEWRKEKRHHFDGPVHLTLHFTFDRPKSHYGSGKNKYAIKPQSPTFHTQKPDGDNLAKACCDILTQCGAWDDDCQIASLTVIKMWAYCRGEEGCMIHIEDMRLPRGS